MGWSYRKSFGSGPFRINFSKSGISYSVGVKGARVNVGPRGTYVNLGSHGISYRRKISGPGAAPAPAVPGSPVMVPAVYEPVHNISSAAIEQLTDTDSKAFINELSDKAAKISYANWLAIFPFIVFLGVLLFTSFSSSTVISQPAVDSTLVRVTSYQGVNIRKGAGARSAIVKAAVSGQTFLLADSTDSKWLKVNFHDTVGYINRRFAAIDHVHHDQVATEEPFLVNPYVAYEFAVGTLGFILLLIRLRRVDKKRFEMELHYDMDEQFQQVYQEFGRHFTDFSASARIWQYLNVHQTSDFKRNAGAGKLIKRTPVAGIATHQVPLRHFVTNIAIPYIKLSHLEFYFLPERLLIRRGNTFGAVFYKHLQITSATTRFIEDETVPGTHRLWTEPGAM
ncbi:MAG: type 3 domain protein [Mucilaginibacter sp.]|nr:type 3 domain protein [Mucilaginibacter sp.]